MSLPPGPALPAPADVLPHRPPFLFIHRAVSLSAEGAVCEGVFAPESPFFAGHFPNHPVVPGVLLLEGMAQTLAWWVMASGKARQVLLGGVDKARFRRVVHPGESVRYEVEIGRVLMTGVHARATARVGGEVAAAATLKGWLEPVDG